MHVAMFQIHFISSESDYKYDLTVLIYNLHHPHRDEVEIRHSGYLIPKVVPPPTASPVTFTTAASPTTPYYTTVTPYDRPERQREELFT